MKTHHVCYEGTLACSGCNPCAHCLNVVNSQVLAQAMRRTTEAIAQARGPMGVVAVAELDAKNFWAVFFGFYGEAWQNLHTAMMSDPKVTERAYDLRDIPGFTSTGRYVPPVVTAPLPAVMSSSPYPPAAVTSPLSALVAQAPMPFIPGTYAVPRGDGTYATSRADAAPGAGADAGAPWALPFTLGDTAAVPVPETAPFAPSPEQIDANRRQQLMVDELQDRAMIAEGEVEVEPKLVVGPADIRRAITADDIAASATVLDTPPTPPSANGLAARSSNERPL